MIKIPKNEPDNETKQKNERLEKGIWISMAALLIILIGVIIFLITNQAKDEIIAENPINKTSEPITTIENIINETPELLITTTENIINETPEPLIATLSDTIKIGIIEPLSGVSAAGGEEELRGIEIANKLYPTILSKEIELDIVDNESDKSSKVASELVSDKVNVVIGSWGSSLSIAAGSVFKNAKIPAVCANCTNPLVTTQNDYYFRSCFIDSYQGVAMAKYAFIF